MQGKCGVTKIHREGNFLFVVNNLSRFCVTIQKARTGVAFPWSIMFVVGFTIHLPLRGADIGQNIFCFTTQAETNYKRPEK